MLNIEDFCEQWTKEVQITERVMNALTDASLKQSITEQHRSLGQLAWHLVMSIQYMSMLGLSFEGPSREQQIPDSASVILDSYRGVSRSFLDAVKSQWTEKDLYVSHDIAGEAWRNGESLQFLIVHQAHHRGQMTVLMRQAGIRIPELYGPTYDTWIDKGMDPLV